MNNSQGLIALRGLEARLELRAQTHRRRSAMMDKFVVLGQQLDQLRRERGVTLEALCEASALSLSKLTPRAPRRPARSVR